jgi:hypothetical protein
MNSGYNPMMFDPVKVSQNQAKSQQPPFYFGGSEVPSSLGFTPTVKMVVKDRKRIKMR